MVNTGKKLDIADLTLLQRQLAAQVVTGTPVSLEGVERVTGTDISYIREDRLAIAVAVTFSWPGLELEEERVCVGRVEFPYVPGLLSFRELPSLLPAVRALSRPPRLLMADGQGIAHPRRFGIASHLGLALDVPTLGCAKSRLVGEYEEPGMERGSRSPLFFEKEVVGAVLRTRAGVKPVFVSVGHRIDLESCVEAVLACGRGCRLPEPQRYAHALTARLKSAWRAGGMPALRRECRPLQGCLCEPGEAI